MCQPAPPVTMTSAITTDCVTAERQPTMLDHLLPTAKTQADRKAGAILIAVGIGIGIALGGLMFDNTGIGVLMGVALGLTMYSFGMRKRLGN